MRKSGRCPLWLNSPLFDELQGKWKDAKYEEKRKKARQNRLSQTGVGSSLHCGGVIPAHEHRRRYVRTFLKFLYKYYVLLLPLMFVM